MFEVLIRLECQMEALRRRLLKSSVRYGNSYFGLAVIAFAISMITGPAELITIPLVGVPVAAVLFIVGLPLVLSIVLLPTGLILW